MLSWEKKIRCFMPVSYTHLDVYKSQLYAGEEMAAFAVGEPLDDQTIVVHFEKGRPEYRGVYQAINFCFAKYAAKNFVFINREQDADEEGLRQAKESYMPSGYLKRCV